MKLTSLTSVTVALCGRELALEPARRGQPAEAAAEDEDVPGHGPSATRRAAAPTIRRRRAAPTRAGRSGANASRHLGGLLAQEAGDDQRARRPRHQPGDVEQQRPDQVGDDGRRPRALVAPQVEPLDRDPRHAVDGGVLARRLDRGGLPVARQHRIPAEPGGGDRQHAAAAAPVGERAVRLELEQQLEAQPRRVVRAGPERLAGVDHHVDARPRAARSHGGRTRSRRNRQLTSTGRW